MSDADHAHGVCSQPCAMCHAEEIALITAEVKRLETENGLLAIASMRAHGVLCSAQYPERAKDEANAREEIGKALGGGAALKYLQRLEHEAIEHAAREVGSARIELDHERAAHERTKARLEEVDLERAQLLVERDKRKGHRLSDGTEVAVGQRVMTVREACERHHLGHAHDEWIHEITSLLGGDSGLVECGPRQISVGHLQLAPAGSEVTCPQCRGWREFMAKMRADAAAHRAAQFKHDELTAELAEARKRLKSAHWRLNDADGALQDAGTPVVDERFDHAIQRLHAERDAARAALTKSAHEHAIMRQRLEKTQAEAAALRGLLKCSGGCGNPPTCYGSYEGGCVEGFCCDECCGHGNEDGWCKPIVDTAKP